MNNINIIGNLGRDPESRTTQTGKKVMVGNGVPVAMGRAVAQAVKRAVGFAQLAA